MRHNPADSRTTQRGRILALLIGARGAWVSLSEVLELGIAQYNARLFELRRMGFGIENRREHCDGRIRSSFRLLTGPASPAHSVLTLDLPQVALVNPGVEGGEPQHGAPLSLFGDLTREPEYPD